METGYKSINRTINQSVNQPNRYKAIDFMTECFSWRSPLSLSLSDGEFDDIASKQVTI